MKVGRVPSEQIDREGAGLRDDLERTEDTLARLRAEREQVAGGKGELEARIQGEGRVASAAEEGKAELLELREKLLEHLDGRIDELRRYFRVATENKADLIRRRGEERREELEQRKLEDERKQRERLIAENRAPRRIDTSALERASRSIDERERDRDEAPYR